MPSAPTSMVDTCLLRRPIKKRRGLASNLPTLARDLKQTLTHGPSHAAHPRVHPSTSPHRLDDPSKKNMKTLLRVWLVCVASLRVLSVVLGYLQPATLTKSVFGLAADQVTPLTARTFGIWTLLSSVVTLMCALNLESGPLYRTTMASFVVALLYFVLEVGVYHTVDVRSAIPPFIIASKSRHGNGCCFICFSPAQFASPCSLRHPSINTTQHCRSCCWQRATHPSS